MHEMTPLQLDEQIKLYQEMTAAFHSLLSHQITAAFLREEEFAEQPISKGEKAARKAYRVLRVVCFELHLLRPLKKTGFYRWGAKKELWKRLNTRPRPPKSIAIADAVPSQALKASAQPYLNTKIINVNNIDLLGAQFSGYSLTHTLHALGMNAKQYVLRKLSNDPDVVPLCPHSAANTLDELMNAYEEDCSVHALVQPYGRLLYQTEDFQNADVVHYHLIHNGVLSLCDLPLLTNAKPSVMTLHDPWLMTGHCVHPVKCEKWKTGCENCERLDALFPMREDRAGQMWQLRKRVLEQSRLELIVASPWMMDFVKASPLTRQLPVHLIPFGIDLSIFYPRENALELRKKYRIPKDAFVLFFRQTNSEFKGLSVIRQALRELGAESPHITLLSVEATGLMTEFASSYHMVEMGGITSAEVMAELYACCDVLLMPSKSDSFGMMAAEAMACARPVIVCDQTALPQTTFAPDCGMVIPQEDAAALTEAVRMLMHNPQERKRRGLLGCELAKQHYDYDLYIQRHLELYEQLKKRDQ